MGEKPHLILLDSNAKRGKHVLNFDKYIVHFRYQFNTKGVVIELFPPNKKKQIDYNNYISPYKNSNIYYNNNKEKSQSTITKSSKNNNNNKNKTEKDVNKCKPFKKRTINKQYKKNILGKCSIQEVFNFSEIPKAIDKFFPYEGPDEKSSTAIKKKLNGKKLEITRSVTENDSNYNNNKNNRMRFSQSDDVEFPRNPCKPNKLLKNSRSDETLCPENSSHFFKRHNSMSRLRRKLNKLQKANNNLQKKVENLNKPYL